jgi:hypothetical protein
MLEIAKDLSSLGITKNGYRTGEADVLVIRTILPPLSP